MFKRESNIIKPLIYIFIFLLLTSFEPPLSVKGGVTKVVIDAGHGGKDPGCIGKKAREKDITLAIALKLGNYIEKNLPDVSVIYTRRDDRFVELFQRADIANKHKADLFISIHCNASKSAEPFGAETFVMGLNKSEANLSVAKKENSSILFEEDYITRYDGFNPNSPEANIIFTLYQNAYLDQSLDLASKIQYQFETLGRFDRGVKQAGFLVLYRTTMPGMLVEAGFLSNKKEEMYLMSDEGQDRIAFSIYKAFKEYKHERESGKKVDIAAIKKTEMQAEKNEDKVKSVDTSKSENNNEILQQKKDSNVHIYVKKSNTDKLAENERYENKVELANEIKTEKREAVTINKGNNRNVIFKVQFLISSTERNTKSAEFKGLEHVGNYKENGIYKYVAGSEDSLDNARILLQKIKEMGFKDAFIVAFNSGKRLKSISEALSIQKKYEEER